jgi:hypothetical protein
MKLINLFFLILGIGAFVLSGYLVIRPSAITYRKDQNTINGSYFGTYTNQYLQSGSFAYTLTDHNFTSGAKDLSTKPTAFGSYSGNFGDMEMKTWNSINNNYYSFKGKFSEDKKSITGTYQNLTTTSEHGTFKLVKQ